MEELNSYLTDLSKLLIVAPTRIDVIEGFIVTLKQKLWGHFQESLQDIMVFGSYDRNTFIDFGEESDVDILVIFKKANFQPQTYLDKVRAFGEMNYPNSEVYPDRPTVVIQMPQIKFELVPAYYLGQDIKIPAPTSKEIKWISTYPVAFKQRLEEKEKNCKNLFRPTIRVLKYWNILNQKPFSAFEIEKLLIGKTLSMSTLKDGYFSCCSSLSDLMQTESQKKCIQNLKESNRRIRVLEKEIFFEYIRCNGHYLI
jgi:hypothetical protein